MKTFLRNPATIFLAFVSCLVSSTAFSATRVISDLDDTIKVTYSNHEQQHVIRALFRREAFSGMAELYRALQANARADGWTGTSLSILTASPIEIAFAAKDFTRLHSITENTELLMREDALNEETEAFKKRKVSEVLTADVESRFVLIGDDTQFDAIVYTWALEQFPGRIDGVFIRRVNQGLSEEAVRALEAKGAFFFQTAFELALEMARRGILPARDLEAVAHATIKTDSLNLLFPYYMGSSVDLLQSANGCNSRLSGIPGVSTPQRLRLQALCEGLRLRLTAELAANAAFLLTWKDTPIQLVSMMNPDGEKILTEVITSEKEPIKIKAAAWILRSMLNKFNWLREKNAPEPLQEAAAKAILKFLEQFS